MHLCARAPYDHDFSSYADAERCPSRLHAEARYSSTVRRRSGASCAPEKPLVACAHFTEPRHGSCSCSCLASLQLAHSPLVLQPRLQQELWQQQQQRQQRGLLRH